MNGERPGAHPCVPRRRPGGGAHPGAGAQPGSVPTTETKETISPG